MFFVLIPTIVLNDMQLCVMYCVCVHVCVHVWCLYCVYMCAFIHAGLNQPLAIVEDTSFLRLLSIIRMLLS